MNHYAQTGQFDFSKTGRIQDGADARIDAAIKMARYYFYLRPERCDVFDSLVACVRSKTRLLRPTPGIGRPGWVAPIFLINRLRGVAERHGHWLRPLDDWQPAGKNLRPEFRALAAHLFLLYPVPAFMDSVWDLPPGPEAFRQQSWYIRLGRGASFRELNLPLNLTRRMEHCARQAPAHHTVLQALRYGEVLGLGGSQKLANQIAHGPLGKKIEHAEFWRTVIYFLINNPEIAPELFNSLIEFIRANKFAGEEVRTTHGIVYRRPPWPDFSIKGRTPASMLRLLRAWNLEFGEKQPGECVTWGASSIQEFRFLEDAAVGKPEREWTIHELLNSGELYAEGRALHHCVYTYTRKCRDAFSTIWSLRLLVDGRQKRMATLEVDPRKGEIIQIRAKRNSYAGVCSRKIIERWAAVAGLRINPRSW